MADKEHMLMEPGKTAVLACIGAGVMIGVPLLGLTGISFAATMSLLLLTSPLFIIFSPVLFGAACIFALAMVGFASAGGMALVAAASVVWIIRSFKGYYNYKLMEGTATIK